jgi:GT2 family glycosyltransferase/tetratricopeptide (TPR) repeat protein
MERSPVSIVIPAWNAWHATRDCLDSLRPTLGVRDEVIVVDNGSDDDTLKELQKYSWVKVIHHDENQGFAKGNNSGAREAQHDILVFLNNDTMLPSRWLDELIFPLDKDEKVGATGPMSNFVSGAQLVADAAYEKTQSIAEFKKFARDWQAEHTSQIEETDRLVGFCIAIRKTAFEQVGGWDERYGLGGFEDDDMCKGLTNNNWKLLICKGSFVHHTGHVTFSDNNVDVFGVQADNGEKFSRKFADNALISACLIMKDESKFILQCIDSLRKFADEIVIYDTGSTDDSVNLARMAGARVIEGYWDDDFSRARNEALNECHGEWILHIDADETLEVRDKKTAMAHLREAKTPDALLIPITNHGDAVTGGRIGHQAVRLFRRANQHWKGRLHEQVALRDSDNKIEAADFPFIHINHYGYTAEAMGDRNKTERNIRLAEADVADGTGDLAYKHMNLGRSYAMAGRMEESLAELQLASEIADRDGASDPVRRAIYRSAADYSLSVGKPEDALDWANKLEDVSEARAMSRYLRGQAYLNLGDPARALKEFEGLKDVTDDEGLTYEEVDVHARRGLAYAAAQEWEKARRELTKAAEKGSQAAIWFPLIQTIEQSGGDVRDIAKMLPEDRLNMVLPQLFLADANIADTIIETYLESHPNNTSVLAFSIRLAPKLEIERALAWTERLHAIGLNEHSPLIARAGIEALPIKQRIISAAIASACFNDERGNEIVSNLASRVSENDFINLIIQLNELAPTTLKDFIIGASSTPKRSMNLARVLHELGAAEEALAVAEFGLNQNGSDQVLNDQAREWVERLRAQVGSNN